jgi:hypothetical protein
MVVLYSFWEAFIHSTPLLFVHKESEKYHLRYVQFFLCQESQFQSDSRENFFNKIYLKLMHISNGMFLNVHICIILSSMPFINNTILITSNHLNIFCYFEKKSSQKIDTYRLAIRFSFTEQLLRMYNISSSTHDSEIRSFKIWPCWS